MNFLNATLLLGTLMASVPIVLHLLARQQPKRIVFPGTQFLAARLTTQKSRLRIRRWWLLAMRIIAILAFAIALARPFVSFNMASTWSTLGIIAVAAVALLFAASTSWTRGLGKPLSLGLLVAAIVTFSIAGIGAVRAITSSQSPQVESGRPIALAIVIDNSPSSAWSLRNQSGNSESNQPDDNRPSQSELVFDRDTWRNTNLGEIIAKSEAILDRLPDGSRLAVVDRSSTPVGFSLDQASARKRLNQLDAIASPVSIRQKIAAATELVGTSDLPDRHVVVVSGLNAASWGMDEPWKLESTSDDGVAISILQVNGSAEQESDQDDSAPDNKTDLVNRFLSLPRIDAASQAPGVPLPLTVQAGLARPNDSATDSSAGPIQRTAVVQLVLIDPDKTLPIVRNQAVVYPKTRLVDRASVTLSTQSLTETTLTLPPLPKGLYHAFIELSGQDPFEWDDRRFLTIDLPEPKRVLIVGEDPDDRSAAALALTAPYAPDDPSAGYRIDQITFQDLPAVQWESLDVVMLIDPPIHWDSETQTLARGAKTLRRSSYDKLVDFAQRGGGLLIGLGPSSEVIAGSNPDAKPTDPPASETPSIVPPLIRSWRAPNPGVMLKISTISQPAVAPLQNSQTSPNWADFPIMRYWQIKPTDAWSILANYQTIRTASENQQTSHPSILTREIGSGHAVVITTPLPALSPQRRDWNKLFSSGDAWPAFVLTRSVVAWLADKQNDRNNLMLGDPAVVRLPDADFTTPLNPWQLYSPGSRIAREVALPVADKSDPARSLGNPSGNTLIIDGVLRPGTYYLRGNDFQGGFSANLSSRWSNNKLLAKDELESRLGDRLVAISPEVNELKLTVNGFGNTAVPLYAPLMLLAAIAFLGEQLLSNRFYGSSRQTASISATSTSGGG